MTENTSNEPALQYRQGTSDEAVIRQIFQDRDYDLTRLTRGGDLIAYWMEQMARGMRPLIVDAGANIGAASIYFHREYPNASIVAIEPDQENFRFLAMNAAGLPVSCLNRAVTARPSMVRVIDPGAGHWGFRTEVVTNDIADDTTVESVQIGQIFASRSDDTYPFIVKIDIEGGEDDLFSGDVEWLEQAPLVIIELHDWLIPKRGTSANFLRAVARLDRDFVIVGENIFSIDNRL